MMYHQHQLHQAQIIQQRNRHALPPSIAARAGLTPMPTTPLTMRPRTSVDAHMFGEDADKWRRRVRPEGSTSEALEEGGGVFGTRVDEVEIEYDGEDGQAYVVRSPPPPWREMDETEGQVVVFRRNGLGELEGAEGTVWENGVVWEGDGEEDEVVKRKFSRLASVGDAVQSVGRDVKRKLSLGGWWRKDSAFPGQEKSKRASAAAEAPKESEVAVSSGSDRGEEYGDGEKGSESASCYESVPVSDVDGGPDGGPLTRCPKTGSRTPPPIASGDPHVLRSAIAKPLLPAVASGRRRARRFGSAAIDTIRFTDMASTPSHLRPQLAFDARLTPYQWCQMINQSMWKAHEIGRFDEGRRDRHIRRAPGNNTTPAAQDKAAVKHRMEIQAEKEHRDKMFAKAQRGEDMARVCGDVQKRSWHWRLSPRGSQVRLQQAWQDMRTRSEPALEQSAIVWDRRGTSPNPVAEAASVVGSVMRQRASTIGLPLTP